MFKRVEAGFFTLEIGPKLVGDFSSFAKESDLGISLGLGSKHVVLQLRDLRPHGLGLSSLLLRSRFVPWHWGMCCRHPGRLGWPHCRRCGGPKMDFDRHIRTSRHRLQLLLPLAVLGDARHERTFSIGLGRLCRRGGRFGRRHVCRRRTGHGQRCWRPCPAGRGPGVGPREDFRGGVSGGRFRGHRRLGHQGSCTRRDPRLRLQPFQRLGQPASERFTRAPRADGRRSQRRGGTRSIRSAIPPSSSRRCHGRRGLV
mmetsp:Transcript_25429/g.76623  ORF Transcript_25429/g.76623 Transcript_25429/m.76623 type:complete len:256 (+) Transcript_25429:3492-4259(+)